MQSPELRETAGLKTITASESKERDADATLSSNGGEFKRKRSPKRSLSKEPCDRSSKSAVRRNENFNNNSKRSLHSPTYSRCKSPRLSCDFSGSCAVGKGSTEQGNKPNFDFSFQDIANWQLQAMQLAFLQQHQQASTLKQQEKQPSGSSSSPEEESNFAQKNYSKSAMALAMASGMLPSPSNALPHQMQQFFSQQVLSPSQLQSMMQQQAMSAQQQQAQHIQEFYRQQQKQIQDFQIQLAAAKQQQKQTSNGVIRPDDPTDNSKLSKEHQQQQIQQQLALQQLLHLQQLQQQQHHHQQQQQAAAALQQQGLAAAVAMAQGRNPSQIHPDVSPAEIQQLLLKHMAESARKDSLLPALSLPSSIGADKSVASKSRDRVEDNRESINGDCGDNDRRISHHRSSRESSPESRMSTATQPLFSHGVCKWPGCDVECSDICAFTRHLDTFHRLDDKSTAQCRVQQQLVEQLEKQLNKERHRLDGMMAHLRMDVKTSRGTSRDDTESLVNGKVVNGRSSQSSLNQMPSTASGSQPALPLFTSPNTANVLASHVQNPLSLPASPISSQHVTGFSSGLFPSTSSVPSSPPLMPHHLSSTGISNGARDGLIHHSKRRHSAGVAISTDLTQNQEFYRNADVRPPFTYASLIRQAVMEAPDQQMTLNEIYNWFQKKFAYFRRNAPTWKSAIRTNLSLHKCFKRCEDVMGSYWTVDDREFRKGRHMKRGRPRKYNERDPSATRAQSPSMRGRMDATNNQHFYNNPVSLGAMQMPFGDAAQLASQTQALFGGSNHVSSYSGLLPFGGISHSLSLDAAMSVDPNEAASNISSLIKLKQQSLSPSASNNSFKEEAAGRERFMVSEAGSNSDTGAKMEAVDESVSINYSRSDEEMDMVSKTHMENRKAVDSPPSSDDVKLCVSPSRSREEEIEERTSGGSAFSDVSGGAESDKPLNLRHNEQESSDAEGIPPRPSIIAARGSFTMLHDQSTE